jgi:hypothetical protein
MLILQKIDGSESFEITWIYDRGEQGFYLKLRKAKNCLAEGEKVVISQYSPKLEKQIRTRISSVEANPINDDLCVKVRNKRDLPYFKRSLARFET